MIKIIFIFWIFLIIINLFLISEVTDLNKMDRRELDYRPSLPRYPVGKGLSFNSCNYAAGKIYCLGGSTNQIIEFDPSNNKAVNMSVSMPIGGFFRSSCAEHSETDNIYCFGGYNGTYSNQIIEYNPVKNEMRIKGTFNHKQLSA